MHFYRSILHILVAYGRLEMIQIALDYNADVNIFGHDGTWVLRFKNGTMFYVLNMFRTLVLQCWELSTTNTRISFNFCWITELPKPSTPGRCITTRNRTFKLLRCILFRNITNPLSGLWLCLLSWTRMVNWRNSCWITALQSKWQIHSSESKSWIHSLFKSM